MTGKKARVIAFYLPQFHPIPENDKWWGKGFTEWTNVGKAKPLFRGHYQPKVPADLGYYDLRLPEVREEQAKMAKAAGIEGFMYWHYWFGNGKTILERPFKETLRTKKPDFPFCLGWANHSWENKTWHTAKSRAKTEVLLEQLYPGNADDEAHFYYLLDAFRDHRYITVDGKPLFLLFAPLNFPEVSRFVILWNKLAQENGLKGIYFVGQSYLNFEINDILKSGLDAVCRGCLADAQVKLRGRYVFEALRRMRIRTNFLPLDKFNYSNIIKHLTEPDLDGRSDIFPTIIPNFDHSPRSGKKGLILHNSTPGLFRKHLQEAIRTVQQKTDDHKILFLRSWNEWGEGNYVEPDLKYGHGYLDVLKSEICN